MIIGITGLNRGENPQPGAAVIRSLRREFKDIHRLVGLVYDPLETGVYVEDGPDTAYTLPYPSAGFESFLQRIDVIGKEESLDLLIPCLDSEIEPLIRLKSQLLERGIRVCLPDREAFDARNKHNLTTLASQCRVNTPKTYPVSSYQEIKEALEKLGFPIMVKGRYYGAKKAHNQAELDHYYQESIVHWGAPVLLQQIVHGEEYNLLGICAKGGEILGYSALKKTVVNSEGKGLSGVTINDPELIEMARKIMSQLEWEGPFELEVLRERSGKYTVIEINPRFPAWVDFPSMLGVNLPAALIHYIEGKTTNIPSCPPGKIFLRHSVELCCDLQDVGTFSATGSLKRNK